MQGWPRIVERKSTLVSPWMEIITRQVQFAPGAELEAYYAIEQPAYLAAFAVTLEGYVVLVRQYRPAIERMSLELPAGLLEPNEEPSAAMARELLEETGYPARSIRLIGKTATCSSRISNDMYSFFIETGERAQHFTEEPGISVVCVTKSELRELITSGDFGEQTHLGVLSLAIGQGLLSI
ncbi:hypothetical protein BSZ21_00880 [Bradyrhizobium canariense]|uniref:NUDIX hydrolase n=1 Tax=Bradyrhizobium canariense TaxID=255045 RepID=UPI000A1960EC|nr:NUDIX hydrolase [Bradyrhizobium canariense]OSI80020.1 hypothetical protein BSZ21_00880 [Bradyrhizobium canariense]